MKRNNRKRVDEPTLAELQTKLDSVRREVRNLTVMGMDPKQPPDQAALIKELERSARAEMRLRSMALAHAKGKQGSHGKKRFLRSTGQRRHNIALTGLHRRVSPPTHCVFPSGSTSGPR